MNRPKKKIAIPTAAQRRGPALSSNAREPAWLATTHNAGVHIRKSQNSLPEGRSFFLKGKETKNTAARDEFDSNQYRKML
jgi:hypothetical protein